MSSQHFLRLLDRLIALTRTANTKRSIAKHPEESLIFIQHYILLLLPQSRPPPSALVRQS